MCLVAVSYTHLSHLQLEFEKAFWLMKCIEEVSGLKAAGMEMLGQIMREANAMETLREHFHLDIFDLYQWNGEHMYKTPWLISEIEEGSQQLAYYKDILKQKDEYIGQQKEQLEKQNAAIEQQQEYIEGQRRQAAHYEEQLDELGRRMEQKTGQLKKYEDKIRDCLLYTSLGGGKGSSDSGGICQIRCCFSGTSKKNIS